jgi:hypothetical protein
VAEQLVGEGIERVVVESTSDYWRPFLYCWRRRLRDYTRLRADLTQERSRHKQRLEKLPGGRPDQARDGGHRHLRGLGPGHAGGADRR